MSPAEPIYELENYQYPPGTAGEMNNPNHPDRKLWGANVRRSMGILQVICGGIECVLGIAFIFYRAYSFENIDFVGWRIWNGGFAILTGFVGVFSVRKKFRVTAYMVTSIITAILSAGCYVYALLGAVFEAHSHNSTASLTIYIMLCVILFIQMAISIIGASFTCGAVCTLTH